MATSKKKSPANEPKPKEGTETTQDVNLSPTMPYYCTWLPGACPEEQTAEAQTMVNTAPPFCPITVAQAIGNHAQTLSAPPNCPTVQQCPPTWNCGGGAQTIYSAPPNCPTVQQCPPTWNCGGGAQTIYSAPPNCPTVQQCPPTWNCGGGANAQVQGTLTVGPNCTGIHTNACLDGPTAYLTCAAPAVANAATTTVHRTFICGPVTQTTFTTTTHPTANTMCFICPPQTMTTTVQGTQAQTVGPVLTVTTTVQPTRVNCVHNTLFTAPPNCTGIHTNTCPIGNTGWQTCTQTGTATTTVHPSYICPSRQRTCPDAIVTLPPACPMTNPMVCPPSVTCPPQAAAQMVGDTWNNPACPSKGCPTPQAITVVTAPPNCTGILTNACPIGHTGWQNCGHTLATVCTQTCTQPPIGQTGWLTCTQAGTGPQPRVNAGNTTTATVCTQIGCLQVPLTAGPNCTGIHTNACTIGHTGWQNCGHTYATVCTQTCTQVGTGPQPQVNLPNTAATVCTQIGCLQVTAPPNCTGIQTNACPIGHTGWQNCGHTLATVCTQTCTQTGCPQPTLHTQIGCPIGNTGWQTCTAGTGPQVIGTAATVCTQFGCPQPTTYTQPFGQCPPLNTVATVCTQFGCPQPTLHTQIACPTAAQAITGIVCTTVITVTTV